MATKKERIADTAWMKDAFVDVQVELALKLKRAAQSISHAGTHGGRRPLD